MSEKSKSPIVVGLNAVILAVTEEEPRILTVRLRSRSDLEDQGHLDALPFGPLDPERDRTLELGLRGWVREQTGLELGYVEQLYTFGDQNRDPRELRGGPRNLSIGYLTLIHEGTAATQSSTRWHPWYDYFPWEDWRRGKPAVVDRIEPALASWVEGTENPHLARERQERIDIAFGSGGAPWDGYRALERYELLYEAGLAGEAIRDRAGGLGQAKPLEPIAHLGRAMCFDHRRILATALTRLRGKIKYRPVVFELLPPTFTLLQLQRVVEALSGRPLHKQNFRRLVDKGGLVEGTGQLTSGTGGRPAELFSFRREVLRERPTPGVGLPGLPGRFAR
jgi:hypothetical protein